MTWACTTTEYVEVPVKPECTPISRPQLQRVSVDELVSVSDETYEKLSKNQKLLINWGGSNVKLLREICRQDE